MHTISHHYLRRTARRKRDQLNKDWLATRKTGTFATPYRVEKAQRGPYRYRVVC